MRETDVNLAQAYARLKVQADRNKRQARKAKREKQPIKSRVLRALARAEERQAARLLKLMSGELVQTDAYIENLRDSMRTDGNVTFPQMQEQAKKDADLDAAMLMNKLRRTSSLNAVIAHHAVAKDNPKDKPLMVCNGCGLITVSKAPPMCRICGGPQEGFKKVE